MAKITKYECDICGCPIQTKYRSITGPAGTFVSSHPSYMRIIFSQLDADRGYSENETRLDICEDCDKALSDLIERRRSNGI